MAAGWLGGCAAPQQAQAPGPAQAQVAMARPAEPAPAEPSSAWGRALQAKGCAWPAVPLGDRLEHLQRELEPLGLEPRLEGCMGLPASQPSPALLLDAWVMDGRKAVAVVRGPLADGEAVDLGLASQPGALPVPDDQVSPDVQFNRRWWQARLGAYGLQAVPGQVRAFVPTP
jgi:hypothetical protein